MEHVRFDRGDVRQRQRLEMDIAAQLAQYKHHLQCPGRVVTGQRHVPIAGEHRQSQRRRRGNDLLAELRDARGPFGSGQVLAAEVGHLIPVHLRRTGRATYRDTLLPAGADEVRLENGEHRRNRRPGGLAQHAATPGDIAGERVFITGRDAAAERLRVQHEDSDGFAHGRAGLTD